MRFWENELFWPPKSMLNFIFSTQIIAWKHDRGTNLEVSNIDFGVDDKLIKFNDKIDTIFRKSQTFWSWL